jgi:hypothetical protein
MYERPTIDELIAAAIGHFETQVIPAVKADPKLYFQTLVAVNVLRVAERELKLGWSHLSHEWDRLNALEGKMFDLPASPDEARMALAKRERDLSLRIRGGDYDDNPGKSALFQHLLNSVRMSLEVANPKFLHTLAEEDGQM